MTDDTDDSVYRRFFTTYLVDLFHALVEDRSIEVGDKSAQELYIEFRRYIAENIADLENEGELRVAFDYRDELLARAEEDARNDRAELALTFYAIWLEHVVNGLLKVGLSRQGYSEEVIKPLIKELGLRTKMSSLWAIAGLTPFDKDSLKLVDQISDQRNAFVHYKWAFYEETARGQLSSHLRVLVEAAERLAQTVLDIESKDFWNGRKDVIVPQILALIVMDTADLADDVAADIVKNRFDQAPDG